MENRFNALYPDNEGYNEAKFKVEIHGMGDPAGHYSSNSLRYNTKEDAEAYAKDLSSRWFGMDSWKVTELVSGSNVKKPVPLKKICEIYEDAKKRQWVVKRESLPKKRGGDYEYWSADCVLPSASFRNDKKGKLLMEIEHYSLTH